MSSAWLVTGCGSTSASGPDVAGTGAYVTPDPTPQITACDGQLGREPVLLAEMGTGRMMLHGSDLILAEDNGRVRRMDRCSGQATEIAKVLWILGAAVRGESLYVVEPLEDLSEFKLLRIPLAGGAPELVMMLPSSYVLFEGGSELYLADIDSNAFINYYRLDESVPQLELLASFDTELGEKSFSLAGINDAGMFFVVVPSVSYNETPRDVPDPCSLDLSFVPPGGTELGPFTGATDVCGVGLLGTDAFVTELVSTTPEGVRVSDVVRQPLDGGEPEVVVHGTETTTPDQGSVAASEGLLCWKLGSRLACQRREPGAGVSLVSAEGDNLWTATIAPDVAYWLRWLPSNRYELLAAVPELQ